MQRAKKEKGRVRVRSLTRLPKGLSADGEVWIVPPEQLIGDETIEAFYPPDDFAFGLHTRAVMFTSKRRDPVRNDLVLFEMQDDHHILGSIVSIEADGYQIFKPIKYTSEEIERLTIAFTSLKTMSVVIACVDAI